MLNELVEYMKIHLISLEQDLEQIEDLPSKDAHYNHLNGQIEATRHLMSVAEGIMAK